MLNESVIIGVVLLVVFGAVSLYLYSQLTYLGKKVGMMESLVVDMRMAVDSLMSEDMMHPAPIPISGPAAAAATGGGEVLDEASAAPEEAFYSNVLEQAHDIAEVSPGAGPGVGAEAQPGVSLEEAIAGLETSDVEVLAAAAAEPPPAAAEPAAVAAAAPNYDAMTRAELTKVAEQRGLHVKKSMSRGEILSLLRRSQPTQIASQTTGTGDVSSGSTGGVFPSGASLDGDFPVDLGQNGATLEVDS